MAAPLSDNERERIIQLCHQGHPCNTIAQKVGRSPDTVSRIARSIGHRFGYTNAARAREARSAFSAERRAQLAARATEEAEKLLDELHGEFLVFNFGGRDNTYEEHTLDEPPVDAKRAMVQSFRELMRTVIDVDRHDNKADEGLAAVDQWLRSITGSGEG